MGVGYSGRSHRGPWRIRHRVQRKVDLDAHDLVHIGVELAQGFANAIEGGAHFLLEPDGLVVRSDRHHLARNEDPVAGRPAYVLMGWCLHARYRPFFLN